MKRAKISKSKMLAMFVVMCFCTFLSAAAGASQWVKTYSGSFNSIQQTSDGGFIAVGPDAWVLKLNQDGSIAWQKGYFPGSISSLQLTSDGGYIAAGFTSFGKSSDVWVLKLNTDGDVVWQKSYGGDGGDGAHSIKQTSDGGYIVAGSFAHYDPKAWLLKLNSDGDIVWQKTYKGIMPSAIIQTTDGGYIVARGPQVFKLTADGNAAWQRKYGEALFNFIQATPDGGYMVAGGLGGFPLALKLDTNGMVVWQRIYRAPGSFFSVRITSDRGYVLAIASSPGLARPDDGLIMKMSENGDIVWLTGIKDLGGVFNFAEETTDGGYIGATSVGLIAKLDRNGDISGCPTIEKFGATTEDVNLTIADEPLSPTDTDVVSQATSATPVNTGKTETTLCSYSASRSAQVTLPIKITSVTGDASGNKRFHKVTEDLVGSFKFYFEGPNPVASEGGCYVSFSSDDGLTTMCFKGAAAISTEVSKSKTDQLLLIGTGNFTMTIDEVPYSGIVYLDAKGTLLKDGLEEIASVNLVGNIAGGVDEGFIFSGHFLITLTR